MVRDAIHHECNILSRKPRLNTYASKNQIKPMRYIAVNNLKRCRIQPYGILNRRCQNVIILITIFDLSKVVKTAENYRIIVYFTVSLELQFASDNVFR